MADMDSFSNRVDKVFGSLGPPSVFTSPWRVSQKQQPKPRKFHEEEDDHGDEEEAEEYRVNDEEEQAKRFPDNRMDVEEEEEVQEVRGMVGLDPTLDFEDEEDEFDRTAVGREDDDWDRIYMREFKQGDRLKVDSSNSLPLSLYDLKRAPRDPRANHSAAKARLEEDAKQAAALSGSLGGEAMDINVQEVYDIKDDKVSGVKRNSSDSCNVELTGAETEFGNTSASFNFSNTAPVGFGMVNPSPSLESDTVNTNSFVSNLELEKVDASSLVNASQSDVSSKTSLVTTNALPSESGSVPNSKPSKRVRFQLDHEPVDQQGPSFVTPKAPSPNASVVPDHVKNPSKYTHYKLDWSDEDNDRSNVDALRACQEILRPNREEQPINQDELNAKILFIPRGDKTHITDQNSSLMEDAGHVNAQTSSSRMCVDQFDSCSIGEVNDSGMDSKIEGDPDSIACQASKIIKGGRKYRTRKETETEMDMSE